MPKLSTENRIAELEKRALADHREIRELRSFLDRIEQVEIQDLINKLGNLERRVERGFNSIPKEVNSLRRY